MLGIELDETFHTVSIGSADRSGTFLHNKLERCLKIRHLYHSKIHFIKLGLSVIDKFGKRNHTCLFSTKNRLVAHFNRNLRTRCISKIQECRKLCTIRTCTDTIIANGTSAPIKCSHRFTRTERGRQFRRQSFLFGSQFRIRKIGSIHIQNLLCQRTEIQHIDQHSTQ